ncbi:carbohydrate kinase family protein [Micromonospora globispora]|uniref:carbohydrate kinase family protein n=1 Tax=Micromonospora globispora TaxID=1450148 RepID=UPI000D6FC588|nr:carbohydrate kinase family protein [Micromonospora globispora]PWU59221.1 carbohydrate kinase family protein [Micromonospora globispora]RQX05958.1 carbohydrate kinase family protein [Micromonospora globispora]
MTDVVYDPLAAQRTADGPDFDVLLSGTVFLDIIFTGLKTMPSAGTEVWAGGMGSCPGGIANLAVASSRLGLRTSLAAAFGDDDYADFCWRTLAEQEGVDLSRSRRFDAWHSPVTVSMAVDRDRSMVTHGHPAPISGNEMIRVPPRARAVMVDLGHDVACGTDEPTWVEAARTQGALVFGDVGWDPTGEWSPRLLDQLAGCDAFLPNAPEAMAYTRTETPNDALYALADVVPLAVVTNGAQGALAIDGTTGEEAQMPALRVPALDPTGAGDVFAAGLVVGTLAGWSLRNRLAFAIMCSGLAVQQFGGSLAAPGWGDIADWWHALRDSLGGGSYMASLRRRYEFLEQIVPTVPLGGVHRAAATIARHADVEGRQLMPRPRPDAVQGVHSPSPRSRR